MSTTVAERRRFEQRQRLTRIVATTSSSAGVVSSSDERENNGVERWLWLLVIMLPPRQRLWLWLQAPSAASFGCNTVSNSDISLGIICESLEPALKGRQQILEHMESEINAPRIQDDKYSPRLANNQGFWIFCTKCSDLELNHYINLFPFIIVFQFVLLYPTRMHMDTRLASGDHYWRTIYDFLEQTGAEKKDSKSKKEEFSIEGDGKSKILDLLTHIYCCKPIAHAY
nr:polyribonucleotide nucleotidyltransferase 2, mitochondrial [Ipomoea batatas]GMD31128.1 polyribonucleotide nucleotidyltransferase 2, mitochondrial [Ipomoea batatas]